MSSGDWTVRLSRPVVYPPRTIVRRRTFLRTSSLLAAGLAGCSEGDPTGAIEASPTVPADLAHLDGIRRSTAPPDSSDQRRLTYRQRFDDRETTLDIDVPEALVSYYGRRRRTTAYGSYVSDGYDDPYIAFLAGRFTEYGESRGLSADRIVDHAMAFVQQLTYTTDEVGTGFNEYPKYPVETLVDRGGDCEDTSILLAAILEQLGYGVILLLLREANHAALGIKGRDIDGYSYDFQDERYYYVETTAPGRRVGEAPESVQGVRAEFVPIDDRPSLVVAWATGVAGNEVRVDALVRNVGKGVARDVAVRFDLHDPTAPDREVAVGRSQPATIPVDGEHRFRLTTRPTATGPVVARLGLFIDDVVHDVDETPPLHP